MTRLEPGAEADAADLDVPFEPLPPEQVVSGEPATRFVDVDETDARTIGVWEHTPGVSTDVEADEVFVVLAGSGVLSFDSVDLADVDLRPGVVVRLTAGMRTTWTVREALRKVYIAP